ncbi:MAG: serine/threonine protein kinase [Moorea sp. SIO2B7]|nr:serine/threonine protein kinase [Moorena sp. SIO2B7]
MIGQTLSGRRYQIISELGRGAFGQTYLAEDTQMPQKVHCVVKQLKPRNTDPYTLKRAKELFEQEAKVFKKLGEYDQITRLFAYFEENQEFYLVQELIDGKDLKKEFTSIGKLSEDEVISLLRDILEVLVFIQQHNVIHRDLKTSNLMRRASDGKTVVIDFGAVKEKISTQGQTRGSFAGTPGYMPSEQFNGKPQLCSDIYAVGMIGIQALAGKSPTQLPMDNDDEVVWRNLVQVSDELAAILTKMVCEQPGDRYQSAAEVLQALENLDSSVTPTISTQNTTVQSQITKIRQRNSFLLALMGLVGVAALVFMFVFLPKFREG